MIDTKEYMRIIKILIRGCCMTLAEHLCPVLDRGITKGCVCLCVRKDAHEEHICGHGCGYKWLAGQESPAVIAEHRELLRRMLTTGATD